MNKSHLLQNMNALVRLRPGALWIDAEGCALPGRDEQWIIEAVTEKTVRLCYTGIRVFELGLDHVREYRTDFTAHPTGRRGFLMLQSWVLVDLKGIEVEPMHPVQGGSHQLVL